MGVQDLWEILDSVEKTVKLEDLQGKVLAIDASCWIFQSIRAKATKGLENFKPHLRNMFWRLLQLNRHGIRGVAVFDGPSPVLKQKTLQKRYGSMPGSKGSSFFGQCVKECEQLLRAMGIPYFTAPGEAEAACAVLNANGLVDGVITTDGDAFLFGAKTIYRNVSADMNKSGDVKCYEASDIEEELGLNREALVGVALLVGCDYTEGVQAIGQIKATKLLRKWNGSDALDKFRSWRKSAELDRIEGYEKLPKPSHCGKCSHLGTKTGHAGSGCAVCGCVSGCTENHSSDSCNCDYHRKSVEYTENKLEVKIRRKALQESDFPDEKIIDAFLNPPDTSAAVSLSWEKPTYDKFEETLRRIVQFESSKAKSLVVETIASYIISSQTFDKQEGISNVKSIKKKRTRSGIDVVDVEWTTIDGVPREHIPLQTQENLAVFSSCFPSLMEDFQQQIAKEKTEKEASKKTKGKRSRTALQHDAKQPTMKEFFGAKKKLPFEQPTKIDESFSGKKPPVKRTVQFAELNLVKKSKSVHEISDSDDSLPDLPDF